MDISIDASTRSREPFSFTNFFLMHKGDLTLAFSFFIYLVSLAALMFTHFKTSSEIAVSMAEAALIGGLCDYIALKMIFERRWYLPNSGVLPRNRDKLIDGIAATIENEWLTPQMIGRKLSDMDLVRPARHVSAGAEAQRHPGAGRARAVNQQCDRLPRIAGEARSPRESSEADAAEDGHANLRGDGPVRCGVDRRAYRGESAQTAARAAERSRAARHDRKRDSRVRDLSFTNPTAMRISLRRS